MTDATGLFVYCALIALGLSLTFLILVCLCTTLITWVLIIGLIVVWYFIDC